MPSHDIEQLYRDVIMDNYKNPHNKGLLHQIGYTPIHMNNPSCGDDMNVEVKIENGVITDIRQDGHGCSICCSSASVMSETLKGKTLEEAQKIIDAFYQMIQANPISEEMEEALGEAIAYTGVSQFPARIKCATLSWKACEKAISEEENK
ncbi:MAG: SUF system NifU family Fe-S cluster assembly protein [Acholeplasmatales bacterium]|nr:SUF system NifU family Fe-S cluster assembly protein [Acholeplasmatales bacterium]